MNKVTFPALNQDVYDTYLKLLLQGRSQECVDLVNQLYADQVPAAAIYLHLFQKSLYDVGHLWETNQISVAVEHIATAITEYAMSLLRPGLFSAERVGRQIVVACINQEYHQIGARMIADICEHYGWDSCFVGANTPDDALYDLVRHKQPDLVGLSTALYANLPRLMNVIKKIREHNPEQLIMVGGQAFSHGGQHWISGLDSVHYIRDIEELGGWLPGVQV